MEGASLESLKLRPEAKLYVVSPVLPWYAPNQDSLKTIALIMHYLTSEEARSYGVDDHTANSLRTLGHLRSHCWELLRQSTGDNIFFTNCIKVEVCPVAFPYGKEIDHVFEIKEEINGMMEKYGNFLKTVIANVSGVHLCSKTVAKKMKENIFGKSEFDQFYLENRDKFFSLKDKDYATCCHPEALLNRGFWNQYITRHALEWDTIYTNIRIYFGNESPCTSADDLVDLKPGTAAHALLMQKLKEESVRRRERGLLDKKLGRRLFNQNHPKLVMHGCSNFGQQSLLLGTGVHNKNNTQWRELKNRADDSKWTARLNELEAWLVDQQVRIKSVIHVGVKYQLI